MLSKLLQPVFICGLLQCLFVAAELTLLSVDRWLFFLLFLYQWAGILFARRFGIRLAPSLLLFLKNPRPLIHSARKLKLFRWVFLGAAIGAVFPQELHPAWVMIGILFGPLAAFWAQRMAPEKELKASNPLFYLQWSWVIHPKQPSRQPIPKREEMRGQVKVPVRMEPGEKPHILFIFLESFRAQNIGVLGANIGASPCFDALAKQGLLFTACSSTGPYTLYAALSSLFGIQPDQNALHLQAYMNRTLKGLPAILKDQGYRSAWIEAGYTSFAGTRPFMRKNGMDEVIGAEELKEGAGFNWGVYDQRLFDYAAEWLKRQSGPSFVSLFTLTNHHPWEAPEDWKFVTEEKVSTEYQRFLNTFSYSDACLGRFVEQLREEGLLEKTILFITGDHGQEIDGDNSITRTRLSQENLHVPLLIYAEGRVTPQRIEGPCSHLDLFPTVIDLLKLDPCPENSLLRERSMPIYFSLPGTPQRWGCRKGKYKWSACSSGKGEELYDLSEDPTEKKNLTLLLRKEAEALKEETFAYFEELSLKRRESLRSGNGQQVPCCTRIDGSLERSVQGMEPHPAEENQATEIFCPSPTARDEELAVSEDFTVVDLSSCTKFTDRGMEKILHKKVRVVSLPKSPLITDRTLLKIANTCPNLISFASTDSPLITSKGVEAIFSNCSQLKRFSLDGTDEITSLQINKKILSLSSLLLGETVRLEEESLLQLVAKSDQLTYFQANIKHICPSLLSKSLKGIFQLCLFEASKLTEENLFSIFEKSPYLSWLKLTDATSLKSLERLPRLQTLILERCPLLKNLEGVQVDELVLIDCPELKLRDVSHSRLVNIRCPKL